jgi:hypothetical protein
MREIYGRSSQTICAIVWLIAATCIAEASDDPCKNYALALAYTRSSDPEPVDLTLVAAIEARDHPLLLTEGTALRIGLRAYRRTFVFRNKVH